MRREWSPEELIESWTLLGQDWTLVGNKSGATRLGFALLLKVFEVEARFPRNADELPPVAVKFVGEQVKVAPALLAVYSWSGRSTLFPVVGEKTLREPVREAKANEHAFAARVRTVLRGSYSNHYRRMLPPLLAALEFGCHNTAYRPVMQASALLARYAGVDGKTRFFADTDTVPIDGVVPRAWRDTVVDDRGRVERIPDELCVLVALRDALRRREIYVHGAHRWRDPDEDLPGDFDSTREVHDAVIPQPTDPTAFIIGLRERMTTALAGRFGLDMDTRLDLTAAPVRAATV